MLNSLTVYKLNIHPNVYIFGDTNFTPCDYIFAMLNVTLKMECTRIISLKVILSTWRA